MPLNKYKTSRSAGFTLVELLIVIVIIAILAAIAIVSYNGIQQRATNTSIKSDVSQIAKLLVMHKTAEGSYPTVINGAHYCATQDDDCRDYTGAVIDDGWYRADFLSNIKQVGTLPQSSAKPSSNYYGISIVSHTNYQLNNEDSPIMITFFLKGKSQSCVGVSGMVSVIDAPISNPGKQNFVASDSSSSNVGNSGVTRCYVMFPV